MRLNAEQLLQQNLEATLSKRLRSRAALAATFRLRSPDVAKVADLSAYITLKAGMAGIETAQTTQHQTNPIAPQWTFRVRTH